MRIEDEKKINGVSEVKMEKNSIRERDGNASVFCSLSVFSMSSPVVSGILNTGNMHCSSSVCVLYMNIAVCVCVSPVLNNVIMTDEGNYGGAM